MSFHRIPPLERPCRVSVVVPCYNYGHYLGGAVDSVLSQAVGGVEVEVIVVDDASPDGSGEVARELARRHPEVTAVVHEQNARHIATYNDGLARATGDLVVLLSADDLLAPGALARAAGIMQRWPAVSLVYGFAPDFDGPMPQPTPTLPHCTVWSGGQWLRSVARSGQNPVSTPAAIMRTSVLAKIGGYDASLPHTADLLMWMLAAAEGDVAYVNGVEQAFYRVHGANMHASYAETATEVGQRRAAFERFGALAASRPDAVELAELVRLAGSALDRELGQSPRSGRPELVQDLAGKLEWRYWRRFGLRGTWA